MPHKTNHTLLTLLALLTAGSSALNVSAAGGALPKVVVNIIVDQLRSDYLEAFMPLYGEEGLKRLLTEGRIYAGAEYPMARIDRASATATLSTGTTPSRHGIVGAQWVEREGLRPVFCVEDHSIQGIGTKDRYSALPLNTSTVTDELKVASEGKAVVVSLAPNAESAILQGGHAADYACWIDDYSGQWVTSSYYTTALPQWLKARNTQLSATGNQIVWEPANALVGNFSYFLSGGMKEPFRHVMKTAERFRQWKTSGLVNSEIASATETLLQVGRLGMDDITDYLALTLYAGGYEGSTAAEAPMEVQDNYVRLDMALARILTALDEKVGRDNLLLCLTSTGYTEESDADLSRYRISTGTFDVQRATGLLAMYLRAVYGVGNLIATTHGTEIYLNHQVIEDHQINYSELLTRCQDFLQQLAGVQDVYGSVRMLQGGWTAGLSEISNGYHVQRSGDLLVAVMPGWHAVNTATGYDRLSRASYVPFPIVFYGAGIKPQRITESTTVDYIAPTLSSAMRIRAPNACSTSPLF